MTQHSHREYVDGCYRCDLSRDEVGVHDCGYPENTFACRIRHQGQPIIKWGRASQSD